MASLLFNQSQPWSNPKVLLNILEAVEKVKGNEIDS